MAKQEQPEVHRPRVRHQWNREDAPVVECRKHRRSAACREGPNRLVLGRLRTSDADTRADR